MFHDPFFMFHDPWSMDHGSFEIFGTLVVQFTQVIERVDSCVVSVAPLELQRVLADDLNLLNFQIVRDMNRKHDADAGHLILT